MVHGRECAFGERAKRMVTKTDFSYFCAITAPEAASEELRTVCDWGNWVGSLPISLRFVDPC